MARFLFGAILLGNVGFAEEAIVSEGVLGDLPDFDCEVFISKNDKGDVCCQEFGWGESEVLTDDILVVQKGPQFSRGYHFFSRAGSVQAGIVLKQLASHVKMFAGDEYDYVLPAGVLATAANYLYVTMRMMENVALEDKDTIDGISQANWIALTRLYVYFFGTLELGRAYAGGAAGELGVLYGAYGRTVPWVALALAAYDLSGKWDKVDALNEPQTEADWATYYKAWNALYVYAAKFAASSIPLVMSTPKSKSFASYLSLASALGFLWYDLSNPN